MDALKSFKAQALMKKQWSMQSSEQSAQNLHVEKVNDRYTIKNIVMNIKLKIRVAKVLNSLQSRKFKNLTDRLYKKINDKAYFNFLGSKSKDNCVDDVIDEKQSTEKQHQSLINKKQTSIQKSTRKLLAEKMKKIIASIPIIDPNSQSKLIWDSFQSFIIAIMIAVTPVKLAVQDFCLSYYLGSWAILFLIFMLIVIDILTNLNTAFFRNGKIEVNRVKIMKNYLHQVGICDILITIILIYELVLTQKIDQVGVLSDELKTNWFYQTNSIILFLLFYIKIQKLHRYFFKLEETFSFKRRTLNILSLVKLLFFIVKVAHVFACIWLYVGRSNRQDSWLKGQNHDSWSVEYLKSYYFITVTMTTIGFGDIVPTNVIETIVSIFSMIIACGVFGYTINSIGSIFLELKKEDEEKQENLFIINRYMSEKNISRDLQSSIREHLEYYWDQWKDDNSEKEQKILEQLSEEMRQSLLLQANRMILEDCQFFQKNFSQEAIQKSVSIIKEKKLTPNEYVINSIDDISKNGILFFVEKGEVDIYQEFSFDSSYTGMQNEANTMPGNNLPQLNQQNYNLTGAQYQTTRFNRTQNDEGQQLLTQNMNANQNQGGQVLTFGGQRNDSSDKEKQKYLKHVCTIKRGQYFGEISFFTNFPNKFIAKSKNFSKILYIEREKFVDFLKSNHFQDDYETFCHIRDSINQNELQCLFQKCSFCQSYDHTHLTCPVVHLCPLRYLLFYKHNFSLDIIDRKFIARREVKFKNCFHNLEQTYDCIDRILEKYENYIEENIKTVAYTQSEMSDSFEQNENSLNTVEDENESKQSDEEDYHFPKTKLHKNTTKTWQKNDESEEINSTNEREQDDHFGIRSKNPSISIRRRESQSPKEKSEYQKKEFPPGSQWKIKLDQHHQPPQQTSENSIEKTSIQQIELNHQTHFNQPSIKNLQRRNNTIRVARKKFTICDMNRGLVLSRRTSNSQKIIERPFEKIMERPFEKIMEKPFEHIIPIQISQQQTVKKQKTQKYIGIRGQEKAFTSKDQKSQQFDESEKTPVYKRKDTKSHQKREKEKEKEKEKHKKEKQVKEELQENKQKFEFRNYSLFNFFNWDVSFVSLFENMKIFKNYYPNYNHDKIILKLKKKRIHENNILKLTLQSKQNIFKKVAGNKESPFQVFKNQVNVLRFQNKINSSQFSKRDSILSVLSPSNFIQSDTINNLEKTDHIIQKDISDQLQDVNKSEQKSTNHLLKNIKFDFSKNVFSPKNSLFLSSFQEKIRNSLHEDNHFDIDDFNIDAVKGSITNRMKISSRYNKIETQLSKDSSDKGEDKLSE